MGAITALLSSTIAWAQLPPGTKRPIRKNLFNRGVSAGDLADPSGNVKKPDDILRVRRQKAPNLLIDPELMPDFSEGDIEDDVDEMSREREDFLNPEWLRPVDPINQLRNESLDELGGDFQEETDLQRERAEEERMEEERTERRELMREVSGQQDPFAYLNNNSRLANPERGRPDALDQSPGMTSPDSARDELGNATSRAHTNLDKRGSEKLEAAGKGEAEEIGQADPNAGRFARANKGSLLSGMGGGSSNMLDNLNKKYGTFAGNDLAGKSAARENTRSSRMKRAFVERNGGVAWRDDLRGPERQRQRLDPSLPGNTSMLAGSTSFSGEERESAGVSRGLFGLGAEERVSAGGGILPSLGGGFSDSTASTGFGSQGSSKSQSTRSILGDDKPKKSRTSFDFGPGIKSGFDNDNFIRNPGKF